MSISHPSDVTTFAMQILQRPLYPYQQAIAEAIISSVLKKEGRIFTVMMARQSGKNQLSAVLEAFLLYSSSSGTIVKAAPTFRPQIMHSRLRLCSLLEAEETRERIWQSQGHLVGLAPVPEQVRAHSGPRVLFLSAAPESNVVGATADLLLEIDEAQDVSREKFDRDFRPMGATCNATTVLYGTAWSETTLLAQQRAVNLELEARTGIRCHFEYNWRTLAALNASYKAFVQNEIARLGEEHIVIQTQYELKALSGTDLLLKPLHHLQLQGTHSWEEEPAEDALYIAGMDVAGEEHQTLNTADRNEGSGRRDSTVLTIGRIREQTFRLPHIEVVHQVCWTGKRYLEQYEATCVLMQHWKIRRLVIDATGQGAMLASMLRDYFGEQRVRPFTFTRPSKSLLGYQLLALIESGRLQLYTPERAPQQEMQTCWRQLRLARYRLPAPGILDFYVDPSDGHDDYLMSLALLPEGLDALAPSAVSTAIQPRAFYRGEGRF